MQQNEVKGLWDQFNAELDSALRATKYPKSEIDPKWLTYTTTCLSIHNPKTLGILSEDYRDLLNQLITGELTMHSVGVFVNALEASSPRQMMMKLKDYADMVDANLKVARKWREFLAPIQESIRTKLRIMQSSPISGTIRSLTKPGIA